MSIVVSALMGSVFPAFFQCTAYPIMPLHDPVADVQMMSATPDFAFDPRFAKLVGVAQAKGHWTGDAWEIGAPAGNGAHFKAKLMKSETDDHHWGLDWDVMADGKQGTISSGIADCRLLDPQTEKKQGK